MTYLRRKILYFIILGLHSGSSVPWRQDGQKACSCYTFENGTTGRKNWRQANVSCIQNKKHLVVLETVQEWEFINQTMKNQTAARYNEWHIGLFKNSTTGNWTWVNGKPLTLDKWWPHGPGKDDRYALMAKEFPTGSYGLFGGMRGRVYRGWICEEETDNCHGVCMYHFKPTTTTSPTTMVDNTLSSTRKKPQEFVVPWRPDGQKACSCYKFENGFTGRKNWQQSKDGCSFDNKHLLVIETLQEWEFINKSITEQKTFPYDEWHIGLFKNVTTGEWTWVNGKPLTLDKWRPHDPGKDDKYALMANEYPPGSYGLFGGINDNTYRGWICEEETDNCHGACMYHFKPTTTTSPTTMVDNTLSSTRKKPQEFVDRVGCFSDFPSALLGRFVDDIDWFLPLPFSKQMKKMVKKCSRVAIAKKLGFFAVENYGNCYGAQTFSNGRERKSTRCNFGVGLKDNYYVYKVSL